MPNINCAVCNKEFTLIPKRVKEKNYCSRECASVGYIASGKKRKIRTCIICNKEFMQAFFMDVTCSIQCEVKHNNIEPLFRYNPENDECEKIDGTELRRICPYLGF